MATNLVVGFLIIWTAVLWALGSFIGRRLARASRLSPGQMIQRHLSNKELLKLQNLASRLQRDNDRLERANARLEQELRRIGR